MTAEMNRREAADQKIAWALGEPVTDDYPGDAPYPFTGGTLHQVSVNVSGEPYVDLERHAEMMLKTQ